MIIVIGGLIFGEDAHVCVLLHNLRRTSRRQVRLGVLEITATNQAGVKNIAPYAGIVIHPS